MSTVDLTQLSDEDLRSALFDALVERLDAKAHEDPSIAVVNRMPTAFAVSRRGNLLTLSQGIGLRLLRGDLKPRDRRETLRTFSVGRAAIQSRLAIMPDRIEGTPEEVLDRIVALFLEWTAAGEESRPEKQPTLGSAQPEGRPTWGGSQVPPALSVAMHERRAASGSTQERRAVAGLHESRPAAAGVIPPTPAEPAAASPVPQTAERPAEAEPVAPRPPGELTTARRTYQLLLETAQRALAEANAQPGGNQYSLISAGVFVAFTAEAFFNDLGSRMIPSWPQLQRLDPREKAEVLNIELFNTKADWNARPFHSVAAALGFRRALAHAHAETLSADYGRTTGHADSAVPRTRKTAWQEHCDIATIQRWISDVQFLIEHFSMAHDATDVAKQ